VTPENELEAAVEALREAIGEALLDDPLKRVRIAEGNAILLLHWLAYLQSTKANGYADELLEAVRSSIVEVAGYIAVRMARPAVHAMRCQLELSLAWLYYVDHPVEWRRTTDHEGDFISHSSSVKYLGQHLPQFNRRLRKLDEVKTREINDPYDLLCSHVHGTSGFALASGGKLTSLVRGEADVNDALRLQEEVAEYLSDVFLSWFGDSWHDLPQQVRNSARARLGGAGLKELTAN
jgi:hypothetical protein